MTVFVDSDILIEVMRRRDKRTLLHWADLAQSNDAVLYSPISEAELWTGVRQHERDLLQNLFSSLSCVSIDGAIGRRAGEYLRIFRASHGLQIADALIAASAATSEAALWTRNRKHYPMSDITFLDAKSS